MAEDLTRIRRYVDALVRRERWLLLARVTARAGLLVAALAVVAVLAAWLRVDRSAAALVWVLTAGVGAWVAVAWPVIREWRGTGDLLRQALRVEALAPELRGRLLTAVERTEGARIGESEAMLGLVARRAAERVAQLSVAAVHPARQAARALVLAGLGWLVVLPVALWAGPDGVMHFWMAGVSAQAAVAGLTFETAEGNATVGDLVLRYRYPDYTGLEDKTVPNSTGDVQGPPGTVVDVTARSAEWVEAAGLEAYGERLDASVDDERRTVGGRFTIQPIAEGSYKLVLYAGGEPSESRDFLIEAQEDLPPDVMLDAGVTDEVLEVALDENFTIGWRARDDYGVRRVGLQIDGRDRGPTLERPTTRKAEVAGTERLSPRDLELAAGDRVKLSVVAYDNDTVSGSKAGSSRAVEIVVLGASGLERREAERQAELLKLMIPVLARYLTEPWPAGDASGELAVWGETVARRYQPLVDAVESLWSGSSRASLDRDMAERVVRAGTYLVRYTQVSFTPGAEEEPAADTFEVTADLRNEAILALEDGILALARMQRNRALAEVAEQASELSNASELLEDLLANDGPDAQELLSRLDQLERMLEKLMESTGQLEEGGLREFLNLRDNETQSLMDEIRKAIAEGDLDEARELMERLSQQLQEMSQGIQDSLEQRQQEGDELGDQMEELMDELEALEEAQRELQAQVSDLRSQDARGSDQAAQMWDTLQKLAAAHRASAGNYLEGLESNGRAFYEKERTRRGIEEADELAGAVEARDVRGARGAVTQGKSAWAAVRSGLERELERVAELPGPGVQRVRGLIGQLLEIERLLDQLEQASGQSSPQTRSQAEPLQQQQRDLDNRLEQARQQAAELGKQLPVRPESMNEALEAAQERTGQATDDLGQGQLMEAEGSQGVAAQRIKEAREALERAQEQMQQQQQQLQPQEPRDGDPDQGDGENREGQEDGQQHKFEDLEIPGREEFRTPEEYRRALLEGMEGEVPEEYRAMKKRYYEELVHQ